LDERYESALKTAEKYYEESEESLYEELGLRIQDITNVGGYERSQKFDAEFEEAAVDLFSFGDLKKIGQRWMENIKNKLMEMICSKEQSELKKITEGKTIPQVVAGLVTAGIVSTFAPPAWIIIAVTILVTKIMDAGIEAACETWKESQKDD
jgi:hypothetical protein